MSPFAQKICGVFFFWTPPLFAQVFIHQYELDNVSFQYSEKKAVGGRCLKWLPLKEEHPPLEYDVEGRPFATVELSAEVSGKCPYRFEPAGAMTVLSKSEKEIHFLVKVYSPLRAVEFYGPQFQDELVIEAPAKKLDEISFFQVFRRARVDFDTGYGMFKTNNPSIPTSVSVYPLFGGQIVLPVPYVRFLSVGYSMRQNMLTRKSSKNVEYSEFSFDLRGEWQGTEAQGRPRIDVIGDYRGRNIFQTGSERPFIIGSVALPGLGVDASWFFAYRLFPWSHWASRFGADLTSRFYYWGTTVDHHPYNALLLGGTLQYRITKKWAWGLGYNYVRQSTQFSTYSARVRETIQSINVKLSLLPAIDREEN